MRKMVYVFVTVVMMVLSGMPVMAKEAKVSETKEAKTYTFSDVVDEIEYYGIEEEETEKIVSVVKNVNYDTENYTLVITYSEPTDDGFEWISITVDNGMIELQAKGPGCVVAAEYTYREFMEQ